MRLASLLAVTALLSLPLTSKADILQYSFTEPSGSASSAKVRVRPHRAAFDAE